MPSATNNLKAQYTHNTATSQQFIVGQDERGRWLVVERHGRGGGIFVDRQTALKYAAFETGHSSESVLCSNETLTLWG